MKKLLSLFLVLVLAMSMMVGCGEKDDDEEKKGDTKPAESVADALAKAQDIEEGKFEVTLAMDIDDASIGTVSAKLFGESSGEEMSMGMNFSMDNELGQYDIELEEAFIIADGSLFINLAGIADVVDEVAPGVLAMYLGDVELGWFEFPLPDDLELNSAVPEAVTEAYVSLLEDILAAGEEEDMKVTFDKSEQIVAVMGVFADFCENDLADVMEACMDIQSSIDLNDYAEKLIDFFYDDIVTIVEGMGLTSDMVDTYVEQIEAMDLNEYLTQYTDEAGISTEADYAEVAEEIRTAMEDIEMNEDTAFSIAATYEDGEFECEIEVTSEEEGAAGTMTITSKVTETNVSVSAPSDLVKLSDFADIILNYLMSSAY